MCGIAGIFDPQGIERHLAAVPLVQRALQHRGPDGSGVYRSRHALLVHTRLAIIDPAGGAQPLLGDAASPSWPDTTPRDLALVANGEIYNHHQLRASLAAQGRQCRTASDCEVILHAYASAGPSFPGLLHGMFALALYDSTNTTLVLVRDRFGIKPLYWCRIGQALAFASEIKGLLPWLPHAPAVDHGTLLHCLRYGHRLPGQSVFSGIEEVLPGEMLIVSANKGLQRRRYHDVLAPPQDVSLAEAPPAEALHEAFMASMAEHLLSDVPLGVFFSGGLDSTLVLAAAQRLLPDPPRAFAMGFAAQPHILATAGRLGVPLQTVTIEPAQLLTRLPEMVWAAEEPLADLACLPTLALAEVAARHVKVVLTGEGADEAFAGYGRYRSPAAERLARWLWRGGPKPAARLDDALFAGPYAQLIHSVDSSYRELWRATAGLADPVARLQGMDLLTNLPGALLPKVDRMLMTHGLEGRVPYLDHRLVALGLWLPAGNKIIHGHGKWPLRQLAARLLPSAVAQELAHQPKVGFHVPLKQLLSGLPWEEWTGHVLRQPIVQEVFVARRVRQRLARGDRQSLRLMMSLVQLSVWTALFLEGRAMPEDMVWASPGLAPHHLLPA